MIKVTTTQLSADAYSGGNPIHDIIRREPADIWYVPSAPIVPDQRIDWTVYQKEQQLLIPLFPYCANPDPALAAAFMAQLGLLAAGTIQHAIKRVHISFARPAHQVSLNDRPAWQFQIGFGIVLL